MLQLYEKWKTHFLASFSSDFGEMLHAAATCGFVEIHVKLFHMNNI